jgi:ribosomal protein S18 acetylase RimI-like enzyme
LATLLKKKYKIFKHQADDHHLIGGIINDRLVGIIGAKLNKNATTIKHISVLEEFRKQGIAKKLIQYVIDYFALKDLYADTDGKTIGFYRSLGFKCREVMSII